MMFKIVLFAFLTVGVLGEYLLVPQDKIQQYQNILREQCIKNGARDKYEKAESAGRAFEGCISKYLNATQVKAEINAAKSRSALSLVTKKYCLKAPNVKTCTQALFDGLSPCLDPSSRYYLAKSATDQFIDFLCEEQGIKMTAFIFEGGPACWERVIDKIRQCVGNERSFFDDSEEAKKLSVQEQCTKYVEMSTCIVDNVKECESTTIFTMAETFFMVIRQFSACICFPSNTAHSRTQARVPATATAQASATA